MYHVVPRADGRWAVLRLGATRATRVFPDRKAALALGRRLAAGGVLYIHWKDGTVESKEEN